MLIDTITVIGSLLPIYGVRVSVRLRLLIGHLLINSCSLGLAIFSLCILTICNISFSRFGFEGWSLGSDHIRSTFRPTFFYFIIIFFFHFHMFCEPSYPSMPLDSINTLL